jgi:catecholate siderophore receptor
VIIKPVDNVSVYGSYSISYLPSAGDQFSSLTPSLAVTVPEKFINNEVGVKWDITPRLQASAAIYDLDRENQRFIVGGQVVALGKTNTKGAELSLTGYVTDQWQVTGGYAYTDARIVDASSATIVPGNRVGLVPLNTFTMWNKYQFNEMWGAGLGVIHYDDFFATSDDTVKLKAFTRVDAAVYFRLDKTWRAQLNIENLFDTSYYATADAPNNITPGSPRAFRASVTANF